MADNIVEFEIQFKNAQASLRNVRKELEKELSGVKIDFDSGSINQLLKGSASKVAGNAQGIKREITDKLDSKLAEVNKKLVERQTKRADILSRIQDTEKQVLEGNKNLKRSLSSLKGSLTKEEKAIATLVTDQQQLSTVIEKVTSILKSAGIVFQGIQLGGLTEAGAKTGAALSKLGKNAESVALSLGRQKQLATSSFGPEGAISSKDKGLLGPLDANKIGAQKVKAENDYVEDLKNTSRVARTELAARYRFLRSLKKEAENKEKEANTDLSRGLSQVAKFKEALGKQELQKAKESANNANLVGNIQVKILRLKNLQAKLDEKKLRESNSELGRGLAQVARYKEALEKQETGAVRERLKDAIAIGSVEKKILKLKQLKAKEENDSLSRGLAQSAKFKEALEKQELKKAEDRASNANILASVEIKILRLKQLQAKQDEKKVQDSNDELGRGLAQAAKLKEGLEKLEIQRSQERLRDSISTGNVQKNILRLKERQFQEEYKNFLAILEGDRSSGKVRAKGPDTTELTRGLAQAAKFKQELEQLEVEKAQERLKEFSQLANVQKKITRLKNIRAKQEEKENNEAYKVFLESLEADRASNAAKLKRNQKEEKLDRALESIKERGLANEEKKLSAARLIRTPNQQGKLESTSVSSSISKVISTPLIKAAETIPGIFKAASDGLSTGLNAALNNVQGAAKNLTNRLDSNAKKLALTTPDILIRTQDGYAHQLVQNAKAQAEAKRSLGELKKEQDDLAGGFRKQLNDLRAKRNRLASSIKDIDDEKVFHAGSTSQTKRRPGLVSELSQTNNDISILEKTLATEMSRKIAAASITGKIAAVEGQIAGLLGQETEIQKRLNNVKLQQEKVANERLAKENAAKNQGIRGIIRRFAERVSSGGGRIPSGPSGIGGEPPPPPSNKPPSSGGGDFFNRLKTNNGLLQAFHSNLKEGDKLAFKFGQTVRRAAENLAAWAAPSIIVFKTISSLQNAVSQLIKLDTQVKRLTFFQAGGDTQQEFGPDSSKIIRQTKLLQAFNTNMANGREAAKLFTQGFKNLTDEATRTGLSIDQVVEAANTVAQIGEVAFLADGTPSELLKATEGLVLLEGGLLSSTRAAELLVSISNQTNTSLENVGTIAAKLSSAADSASLSFEGFASVITRFAAVAEDIQGLTLDQTIELADVAAKRFGTNASRTGTALKNLTTLVIANRDELESLTGIKIAVGENGKIVGKDALLDLLSAVKETAGTAKGVAIADLLGGRQNLSDVVNISNAIDEIRERFADLDDEQKSGARTNAQVTAFMTKLGIVSEGAESSVNRLSTAFLEFTQSTGAVKLVETFNESLTSLLKFSTATVGEISVISGALNALTGLATILFATFAKKSLLAGVGVFANKATEQLRREVSQGLKKPFNIEGSVQKLQEGGIIDEARANRFLETRDRLLSQSLSIQEKGKAQQTIVNKLRQTEGVSVARINAEQTKLNSLKKQFIAINKQDFALRQQIINQTTKSGNFKQTVQENAGLLIGVAAQTVNAAFGDIMADAISSGIGGSREKVREEINGLFNGITVGAQIGSLFGLKGAAIGGAIGGALGLIEKAAGGILHITGLINKEEDERERKLKRQLDLINQQRKAVAFTQEETDRKRRREDQRQSLGPIEKQKQDISREIEDLIAAQERINALLNENDGLGLGSEGGILVKERNKIEDKIRQLNIKEKAINEKLSAQELDAAKQRLVFEQQISKIQASRERFNSSISLAKLINSFNKNGEQKIKLDLLLDRGQIASDIDNLQREIDVANNEIFAAGDDPKKKGQRESAEKRVLDLVKEQVALRFKVIEADVNAQKAIFDLSEKRLDSILDRFKTMTSELESAFQSILGAQEKITNLNSSSLDITQRQIQARRGDDAGARGIEGNTIRDRINSNQSRAANSRALINDLTSQLSKLDTFSQNQRNTINNRLPQFGKNREDEILGLKNLIAEVTSQTPDQEGNFSKPQQVLQAILAQEEASVKAKIEADRRLIEIGRDNANRSIDINEQLISAEREKIEAIREEIDNIREKAAREAELGDRAINDPESIIKDFIGANFAKQFVNSLGLNTSGRRNRENSRNLNERFDEDKSGGLNADERLNAFITRASEQLQRQGPRANAGILEGLKAQQRLRPDSQVGGVDIEKAIEIFQRLNSGAGLQELLDSVGKETEARGRSIDSAIEIREANNRLIASLNELKLANEAEITLEKQLRDIETQRLDILIQQNKVTGQALVGDAFTKVIIATDNLSATMSVFDTFMKDTTNTIGNLHTQFGDLGVEVGRVIDKLREDREQESIPDPFSENKEFNNKFDSEIYNRFLEESGKLLRDFSSSVGESMTSAIGQLEEKLDNVTIKVETDVPALEVKLNASVQNVINGDEFLAKLTEELRGSGLEDRVEQIRAIVLQLVAVEKVRGTRLLPGF